MVCIEIIPNLYFGDNKNVNVNCIVNCSKDLSFLGKYKEYNINISDNLEKYEIIKMYEYLNETVEFINDNLINNKSILVYCENGNQKSPTIIAAYLIKYGNMSYLNAIKSIRSKYNTAFYPSINFENSLAMFESKYLKN